MTDDMVALPLEYLDGFELRVTTSASVWLIREDRYCRLPLAESGRVPPSPALEDGCWHEHEGAWAFRFPDGGGPHIRLLPVGRPPGSFGVHTGVVERVERHPGSGADHGPSGTGRSAGRPHVPAADRR